MARRLQRAIPTVMGIDVLGADEAWLCGLLFRHLAIHGQCSPLPTGGTATASCPGYRASRSARATVASALSECLLVVAEVDVFHRVAERFLGRAVFAAQSE